MRERLRNSFLPAAVEHLSFLSIHIRPVHTVADMPEDVLRVVKAAGDARTISFRPVVLVIPVKRPDASESQYGAPSPVKAGMK